MHGISHSSSLNVERCRGPCALPQAGGPLRLSLANWPAAAGAGLLQQCFAQFGYRYEIERLPHVPFKADLALNVLPGLSIVEGTLHGTRTCRTKQLAEDGTDDALLMISLRGPHLIEQFGREVVLGDGDAVLVSGSDRSCFTHRPPGELLALRLPKTRVKGMLRVDHSLYMQRIPAGVAALRLLRNHVKQSWARDVVTDVSLIRLLSEQITDLMAATVGATNDAAEGGNASGLRAARLSLVKREVMLRLQDPGLSVGQLSKHFRCSERSLQRLFELDGQSFSHFVLQKRLALAHRMLSNPVLRAEKISSVAYDCGFSDVSYFNRAFRRAYGSAPSLVRIS